MNFTEIFQDYFRGEKQTGAFASVVSHQHSHSGGFPDAKLL